MKTGLVLEGGGMRGMFTAGVLDVFLENNLKFDGAIGVSAGAVFGCNFKSQQIGRVIRYNTNYCRDYRYCSLRSLITTGNLFGADFCYNKLPNELDIFDIDTYKRNPMKFCVVTTDIEKGVAIYKECDNGDQNDLEWYRASASLPLVSRAVEIDGLKLMDGGIADPIPLKHFEELGYNKNIVILTQPDNFIKRPDKSVRLIKHVYKHYPELIKAMERRHNVYNEQLNYVSCREKSGDVLAIRPPVILPVGRIEHSSKKLYLAYSMGREVAENKIKEIKGFLGYV
ncbi:MAG: patatin family protein [Ruminococcaceae bacterium]|nr:patatin family protein [Oscillospiraceae bacterium]